MSLSEKMICYCRIPISDTHEEMIPTYLNIDDVREAVTELKRQVSKWSTSTAADLGIIDEIFGDKLI